MIHILFIFGLLSSSISHASNVNEFCVADLKGPNSPSGYNCKPPESVTANEFVYYLNPANTSTVYKSGLNTGFVKDFPAVNGLGLSALRVDMAKDGVVAMHSHPGANEILMVTAGDIIAGFITAPTAFPPSTLYQNKLKTGDLMVIPQGLMHYQVNIGKGNATFYAFFNSANPRVHIFDVVAFGNNLASDIISKTTLIDVPQVKKLKLIFGGSG